MLYLLVGNVRIKEELIIIKLIKFGHESFEECIWDNTSLSPPFFYDMIFSSFRIWFGFYNICEIMLFDNPHPVPDNTI